MFSVKINLKEELLDTPWLSPHMVFSSGRVHAVFWSVCLLPLQPPSGGPEDEKHAARRKPWTERHKKSSSR